MSSLSWPISGSSFKVLDGVIVDNIARYKWLVVVGGILAFAMAWGIGANDVANAFATSVGAGSLNLRTACLIAAVMEFSGAILLGSHVTDTVRGKIIKADVFDPVEGGPANGPEILMLAFFSALIAATTWLILATYLNLPVSTTHSIIGALIGTGLVFDGKDAIVWISDGSGLEKMKGVVGVVSSWFISPVLSAIFALTLFLVVRTLVLRSKMPVRNAFLFLPVFYMLTIAVTLFFIIYKGSPRLNLEDKFSVGQAAAISLGSGAVIGMLSWFFILPFAKRSIDRWEARQLEKLKNPELAESKEKKIDSALQKVGINITMDKTLDDDVMQLHENAEKFDPKAERLFTWLQVFTAAFDSFAHGANDVANAIAPFSSIYQIHKNRGIIGAFKASKFDSSGKYSGGLKSGKSFEKDDSIPDHEAYCGKGSDDETKYFACNPKSEPKFPFLTTSEGEGVKFSVYDDEGKYQGEDATCYSECTAGNVVKYSTKKQSVDVWILALGGAGIVAGLAMWGYRIIAAIGTNLTKMTPSRGFSIEVGAAITVIIASRIGLPVSTTHCQVGATIGVGLAEFKANTVNWKSFFFIFLGWVFTIIFTGFLAGGIFALLVHSPSKQSHGGSLKHCPGDSLFQFDAAAKGFRGIGCSGLPTK